MTEDPTRAMPRDNQAASHGSVGPADPTADPATHPSLMPVSPPGLPGESPTVPTPTLPPGSVEPRPHDQQPRTPRPGDSQPLEVERTRSGMLWVGVLLSAVVLIFLLIFILQNNVPVRINFLGTSGTLPTGVALLFAAVAGLLLGAIPGTMRILQLRRAARRAGRTPH
jgi:uncharacterized integral membrane protein